MARRFRDVASDRFQTTIESSNATSATQVKAKTADKKMYIHTLVVSVSAAMGVQFQDDASTPEVLIESMSLAADGGAVMTFDPITPLVVTTNQDLDVVSTATGTISVTVVGYLAP